MKVLVLAGTFAIGVVAGYFTVHPTPAPRTIRVICRPFPLTITSQTPGVVINNELQCWRAPQ